MPTITSATHVDVHRWAMECTFHTSYKFWEMVVVPGPDRATTITRYGRIGTKGAVVAHGYRDLEEALRYAQMKTDEKVGHYYAISQDLHTSPVPAGLVAALCVPPGKSVKGSPEAVSILRALGVLA